MSYPDLQHEIAERVDPPGFDEVLARASGARRRRRTTVGVGLAASLVVGGLAFAVGDPSPTDRRSGEPAAPSPTETWDGSSEAHPDLPTQVRELLESDFLDARSVAGSGAGVATIWHACAENEDCRLVLTTRVGDVSDGRVLEGANPTLVPVPDGWLLDDESGVSRLTLDAEWQPITEAAGWPVPSVEPGDTAVWSPESGWGLLRGSELRPVPAPAGTAVESAYVTPSGRLVVATAEGAGFAVSTTDDGTGWARLRPVRRPRSASTAVLAGHGEGVALVLLGDDPDGSIPVVDVQVTAHAGAPFVPASGLDLEGADGLRNLSALAVSDEGTAFLTTESHGVVSVGTDGSSRAQRLSSHDHSVFAADDRVCLVSEAGRRDHLQCSSDDGVTWEAEPLPGFR